MRKVGDYVKSLIGPYKGCIVKILKIEMNAGARNGWFTVEFKDGSEGLYAGEEISGSIEDIEKLKEIE